MYSNVLIMPKNQLSLWEWKIPKNPDVSDSDRRDAQIRAWNMEKAVGGLEYWYKIMYA